MKNLISLAIAGLIQAAVAPEGRQFGNNASVETLAKRLALLIPEENVEMLITGVPVNLKIIDETALLTSLSKRVRYPIDNLRIRGVEIDNAFRGVIRYSYSETRYAKTEEDATNFNDTEDWYNCSSEPRDDRQFPFKAWCGNSCNLELTDSQLEKYGLMVELL
jgi:hypothetical protein